MDLALSAPSPRVAPRDPVLVRCDAVSERQAELKRFGPSRILAVFLDAIGRAHAADDVRIECSTLSFGIFRSSDPDISDRIFRRPEPPGSLIEIGCGSTYGFSESVGAPHLARALAAEPDLGGSITVSDYSRAFALAALTPGDTPKFSVHFPGGDRGGTLAPTPLDRPEQGASFRDLAPYLHPDAEVWVRPSLDPEIERLAFGLNAVDIDYMKLEAAHAPGGRGFDFVFGRYLYPFESKAERDTLVAAVTRSLAPGGAAYVHTDTPNFRLIPADLPPEDFLIEIRGS